MRIFPPPSSSAVVLIGGLLLHLNETCDPPPGVSFLSLASLSYMGMHAPRVEIECGPKVEGLLPLLAARSIEHAAVVHIVGDGAEWARRVRGGAWHIPCALTGRTREACDSARFAEKVAVWCEVNTFIKSSSSASSSSYTTTTTPKRSSATRLPGLSAEARACLDAF